MSSRSGRPQAAKIIVPAVAFAPSARNSLRLIFMRLFGPLSESNLMVARRAIGRRVVVAVAVHALAHLQFFNLCDLFHCCNVAVAGRTYCCSPNIRTVCTAG